MGKVSWGYPFLKGWSNISKSDKGGPMVGSSIIGDVIMPTNK